MTQVKVEWDQVYREIYLQFDTKCHIRYEHFLNSITKAPELDSLIKSFDSDRSSNYDYIFLTLRDSIWIERPRGVTLWNMINHFTFLLRFDSFEFYEFAEDFYHGDIKSDALSWTWMANSSHEIYLDMVKSVINKNNSFEIYENDTSKYVPKVFTDMKIDKDDLKDFRWYSHYPLKLTFDVEENYKFAYLLFLYVVLDAELFLLVDITYWNWVIVDEFSLSNHLSEKFWEELSIKNTNVIELRSKIDPALSNLKGTSLVEGLKDYYERFCIDHNQWSNTKTQLLTLINKAKNFFVECEKEGVKDIIELSIIQKWESPIHYSDSINKWFTSMNRSVMIDFERRCITFNWSELIENVAFHNIKEKSLGDKTYRSLALLYSILKEQKRGNISISDLVDYSSYMNYFTRRIPPKRKTRWMVKVSSMITNIRALIKFYNLPYEIIRKDEDDFGKNWELSDLST